MPNDAGVEFPWLPQYTALTRAAGLVDLSDRSLVSLAGDDRATFLTSFCTNDIKKLPVDAGCEAFFTSVQGKILGFGYVFNDGDTLTIETAPEQSAKLIAHLDRYLIREKVILSDAGVDRGELLVAGSSAGELLTGLLGAGPPDKLLASQSGVMAGVAVRARRVDWVGLLGWLIESPRGDLAAVKQAILAAGATQCGRETFEAARIEAGTPIYGADITEKNLPQELGRDARAISFVKGCYLGQETVARIDALGHVNRLLVGVRFDGVSVPPQGTELLFDAHRVGEVTSASYSPRLGKPLALAYVRREQSAPTSRLESSVGPAEVIALPLP